VPGGVPAVAGKNTRSRLVFWPIALYNKYRPSGTNRSDPWAWWIANSSSSFPVPAGILLVDAVTSTLRFEAKTSRVPFGDQTGLALSRIERKPRGTPRATSSTQTSRLPAGNSPWSTATRIPVRATASGRCRTPGRPEGFRETCPAGRNHTSCERPPAGAVAISQTLPLADTEENSKRQPGEPTCSASGNDSPAGSKRMASSGRRHQCALTQKSTVWPFCDPGRRSIRATLIGGHQALPIRAIERSQIDARRLRVWPCATK